MKMIDADAATELTIALQQIETEVVERASAIANLLDNKLENDATVDRLLAEVRNRVLSFSQFLLRMSAVNRESVDTGGMSKLLSDATRLRGDFNQWHAVEGLVRAQQNREPVPLYPEMKLEPIVLQQLKVSDDIITGLQRLLNPIEQDAQAEGHGCYPDVGLPQSRFLRHLHAAYRVLLVQRRGLPKRFIDIGCGGGLKVLSAARFFDEAAGLEYDLGYVKSARELLRLDDHGMTEVIHGDALAFDDYGRFDVIYFFKPMNSPEKLEDLERRIIERSRPGTVLMAPYREFEVTASQLQCPKICGRLFLVGASPEEAAAVREQAMNTGLCIGPAPRSVAKTWAPILEVSRLKGFAMQPGFDAWAR
ncbi:MAG: class I SAM-dependent methyltransferase [Gammaproteobacteria bacterium]|nr:class I SAM-dependent methyltransferase [Gammaproteobacteria bacterium]